MNSFVTSKFTTTASITTRFVLEITRKCYNVEKPIHVASTTTVSLTTIVTKISYPQPSQETSSNATRPTTAEKYFRASTTTEQNTNVNRLVPCEESMISGDMAFECNKTTPGIGENKGNEHKSNMQVPTPLTTSSLEVAKIEWMESKRLEFEKKRNSLMGFSDGVTENFRIDVTDTRRPELIPTNTYISISNENKNSDFQTIIVLPSLKPEKVDHSFEHTRSNFPNSLPPFHISTSSTVPNVSYTAPVIYNSKHIATVTSSMPMKYGDSIRPVFLSEGYAHVRPTRLHSTKMTNRNTLLYNGSGNLHTKFPQNIGILPSDPDFSTSLPAPIESSGFTLSSKETESIFDHGDFLSNHPDLSTTSSLNSRLPFSTKGELNHSAIFSSKSQYFLSKNIQSVTKEPVLHPSVSIKQQLLSTITKFVTKPNDKTVLYYTSSLYPSESSLLLNSAEELSSLSSQYDTFIPTSYIETPTLSSSINSHFHSSNPLSTPPLSTEIDDSLSSSEWILMITDTMDISSNAASTHYDSSTMRSATDKGIDNSTVPQKKTDDDLDQETFWPVVAALVVGIPSVVVFGIAIVVIHRRRLAKPSQTTTTISSLNSEL